jgi:hypothetical protein
MQQFGRAAPLALRHEPTLRPSAWDNTAPTRPVDGIEPDLLDLARRAEVAIPRLSEEEDGDGDDATEEEVTAARKVVSRVSAEAPPSRSEIQLRPKAVPRPAVRSTRSQAPTRVIAPEQTQTQIPDGPPKAVPPARLSPPASSRPSLPRPPLETRSPAPARVSIDELILVPPPLPRPLASTHLPPSGSLPVTRCDVRARSKAHKAIANDAVQDPFARGRATFVMLCIAAFCAAMAVGILASTLGKIHRICGGSSVTRAP